MQQEPEWLPVVCAAAEGGRLCEKSAGALGAPCAALGCVGGRGGLPVVDVALWRGRPKDRSCLACSIADKNAAAIRAVLSPVGQDNTSCCGTKGVICDRRPAFEEGFKVAQAIWADETPGVDPFALETAQVHEPA